MLFYTPPSSKESAVLFFDYWADGHHQFSPPPPKVELEDHSPCGDFQINCQSKSLPRADWDVVILAKMHLMHRHSGGGNVGDGVILLS